MNTKPRSGSRPKKTAPVRSAMIEEILHKKQLEQKAILNNIPDIAWLKDRESIFIAVNEPFGKSCGVLPDDLVGKTDLDIWPRHLAELYRADDREVMETQSRKVVEEPFIGKDGRETWIETIKTPIINEAGEVIGTTGIARDITARKQRETEYRAILQTTVDGFWINDFQGHFLDVNEAYCRLIGYSREELLTMRITDVEAVERPEDTARRIEKILEIGGDRFETRHRRKDGGHIDVEVSVTYQNIFGGRLYAFLRDITERKEMEGKLKRYSEDLETMVNMRTAELEEKTIQAEAALRVKSDFLSNISHELKTPLNAIIGFSELLETGDAGTFTDEQKEYLKNIRDSGMHLNRIINSILTMREIESNDMGLELSEFPLKETIEEVLGRFSHKAKEKSISLSTDILEDVGQIRADQQKIRQVIEHLLGNALKFTPQGGSVRVSARKIADFPRQPTVDISVTDTGIGIAKKDLGRLFHPFQQLAPTMTKEYEGVGLGLSICKKYVGLHGGEIWVETEPGKGSTFHIAIPI